MVDKTNATAFTNDNDVLEMIVTHTQHGEIPLDEVEIVLIGVDRVRLQGQVLKDLIAALRFHGGLADGE